MEKLLENSSLYLSSLATPHKRYFYDHVDWDDKLIGLIGARGVGKTTFILNYLKNLDIPLSKKLYISADSIDAAGNSLIEIAKKFEAMGGKILAIDEMHKYRNFEVELKQIYDMLPLNVIFSGSSAVNLEHKKADLSRRAVIYRIDGLSFREFIEFKADKALPSFNDRDTVAPSHGDR